MDVSALFCVPRNKPDLWVTILFIYTFLSVWPQEVIYRTFFFERYKTIFTNKNIFIFTYTKTKSTTLVSIEHALYGNWLFTVGMGQMLAFPGMDAC